MIHDCVWNSLYFYWTNFWFLLPVVLLVLWSLTLLQHPKFSLILSSVLVILLVYFISIIQYSAFNANGLLSTVHAESTNPLLTNSVNKYHPFIFYCMVLGLVYQYQLSLSFSKHYIGRLLIRYRSEEHLIYTVITLSLGG